MAKKAIFDKKNILVIGGAGFVGAHLCEELLADAKVICVDNFRTGEDENIAHLYQNPDFEFIKHDIVEPLVLEKLPELAKFKIEFQGVQEIYFLASPTSPRDYKKYPLETLLVNSQGLRQALDLAVKYKAQFLFASAPAVYGDVPLGELVKENFVGAFNQLSEAACYGEAKRFGESLVNNYRQTHNLDAKIVRIFNGYGPKMRLSDGRAIPEMIAAALSGRELIIIGDEKTSTSCFYISDLIKGLTKMMNSGEKGPINLGSDWRLTVKEVAEKIIGLTGSKSKITYQQGTTDQIVPDIALAKEKLGWFPIILLEDGLKETIDYLQAQMNIREPGSRK